MANLYYAGIGARKTPTTALVKMTKIAARLSESGFILRSGGATGADMAFERGCDNKCEIFLPRANYNRSRHVYEPINNVTYELAKEFGVHHCKYRSRNINQILGKNCDNHSDFVICWTEGARAVGGTGFSIKVARKYGIPVFNLADPAFDEKFNSYMNYNIERFKKIKNVVDTPPFSC